MNDNPTKSNTPRPMIIQNTLHTMTSSQIAESVENRRTTTSDVIDYIIQLRVALLAAETERNSLAQASKQEGKVEAVEARIEAAQQEAYHDEVKRLAEQIWPTLIPVMSHTHPNAVTRFAEHAYALATAMVDMDNAMRSGEEESKEATQPFTAEQVTDWWNTTVHNICEALSEGAEEALRNPMANTIIQRALVRDCSRASEVSVMKATQIASCTLMEVLHIEVRGSKGSVLKTGTERDGCGGSLQSDG